MRYLGGKQRLGRTIAEYVQLILDLDGLTTYCEPFCGMLGVGRRVRAPVRIFRDIHPDLVLLLRAVRDGWAPPSTLTESEYKILRAADPSALRGFAGFACSFGGKWFAGYARDATGLNYAAGQSQSAVKMAPDLAGAVINWGHYSRSPAADLTYCDPPYAGTTPYKGTPPFDHGQFWAWVHDRRGVVLVSEYTAPAWMEVIWEKPVKCTIKREATAASGKNARTEKLFAKWN